MSAVLLAAFKILISRWAGNYYLLVGMPNANRTTPATKDIVGFLALCLLLRTEVSPEMKFKLALKCTYEWFLEAYAHQDLYPGFPELTLGRSYYLFGLESFSRHRMALAGTSIIDPRLCSAKSRGTYANIISRYGGIATSGNVRHVFAYIHNMFAILHSPRPEG